MINNLGPDQISHSAASDLDLYCLFSTSGKYRMSKDSNCTIVLSMLIFTIFGFKALDTFELRLPAHQIPSEKGSTLKGFCKQRGKAQFVVCRISPEGDKGIMTRNVNKPCLLDIQPPQKPKHNRRKDNVKTVYLSRTKTVCMGYIKIHGHTW